MFDRRTFVKGSLSVAVIATIPIPPINRRMRTFESSILERMSQPSICRYSGETDAGLRVRILAAMEKIQ